MIDSNNINVMREKLRKMSGGSGVQEEIERIDNLIGSSPIPGKQRTITSSLNYLYDNIGGGVKVKKYIGTGSNTNEIEFDEDEKPSFILSIGGKYSNGNSIYAFAFAWGVENYPYFICNSDGTVQIFVGTSKPSYDGNKLTITGSNAYGAFNEEGTEFSIVYI